MKASKEKKTKERKKLSFSKKLAIGVLGAAALILAVYLLYYFFHYTLYREYKDYLSSYEYEEGTAYKPMKETAPSVKGMELVAENEYLKLYTDTSTCYVAVYDKRNNTVTYSNPLDAEEDSVANKTNISFMKSQFILYYYNTDVKSGTYNTFDDSVYKKQYTFEGIKDGIRYTYEIGDKKKSGDTQGIYFEVPLEYRLTDDGLTVSIPTGQIKEYGNGSVYRIQLLRYMGAPDETEEGYFVVPNGSGSLINFNNKKQGAANYSQYIYDIDPLASSYTTTENITGARLPLFGICRNDRSILATIEDGASICLLTAGISGNYSDYNYAYPSFVIRNADNLKMFGDSAQDTFILEPDIYDVNLSVKYTFLTEEYKGYSGLANYYRERLVSEGRLTRTVEEGEVPFFYDVIAAVKETGHFLGVQYLHSMAMTTFDEAKSMSDELKQAGVSNQVMNLQGWFNEGYYHDTADRIKVVSRLGGRKGLEALSSVLKENGGILYADTAMNKVTFIDSGFNYSAEGSRYYGAGYAVSFGQVSPVTLSNNAGLSYMETRYNLLSPKFLPRYVERFLKKIDRYDIGGISFRDLGNTLASDKKRTEIITREESLDVLLSQFDEIAKANRPVLTDSPNDYAFKYTTDIINAPTDASDFDIIDEKIPLYGMILHGYKDYSSTLLNYEDADHLDTTVLTLIENGACPHYVFTMKDSNLMKETGLNRFYATTFDNWKDVSVGVYEKVNDALCDVRTNTVKEHEILENGIRKITYDNGVVFYINYSDEDMTVGSITIPGKGYVKEGR